MDWIGKSLFNTFLVFVILSVLYALLCIVVVSLYLAFLYLAVFTGICLACFTCSCFFFFVLPVSLVVVVWQLIATVPFIPFPCTLHSGIKSSWSCFQQQDRRRGALLMLQSPVGIWTQAGQKKKHENSRLALSIINCQGVYTIHLLLHTGLLSATVKWVSLFCFLPKWIL